MDFMKWISLNFIWKSMLALIRSNHFVRVFDRNNQKILKGNLIYVTESSMVVLTMTQLVELRVGEIELIKTNRSLGHYMLLSAVIFFIVGFSTNLMANHLVTELLIDSTFEQSGFNALAAAVPGALVGFAIRESKPPSFIVVNRDLNRWKKVNQSLKIWLEQ
jgi:hypothetical protein